MSADQADEDIDDRLAEWQLAHEQGRDVSVETLCHDRPEMIEPLRQRIEKLRATTWMLVDPASDDHEDLSDIDPANPLGDTRQDVDEKTVAEFVESVSDSGILSDQQLDLVKECANQCETSKASDLAKRLIDQKLLTEYQARVILNGSESPLLLDRYVILDAIGSGGMGLVFKALHRSMERVVAIKVLPQYAVNSPEKVKRFQREVKSAAKFSHPNVVEAYDAHERNGSYFLVMEFVDGKTLQQHVAQHKTFGVMEAAQVIDQVAAGLGAAHDSGLIHRDVKPTNIMLTRSGKAKLLDLGLARTMQLATPPAENDLTKDGLAMGTASYMSPEQALDAKEADIRSDIYSLGCTLYFMLTGNPPFKRKTTVQTIVAHREDPAPSIRQSREDVPEHIERIFQKMVAKNPAERYQTADELRTDLRSGDAFPPIQQTAAPSDSRETITAPRRINNRTTSTRVGWALIAFCLLLSATWWGWRSVRSPIESDAVHRDVAKWALATGGYVTAETEFGPQDLFDTSEIPEGQFRITGLDLYGTDDEFEITPAMRIGSLQSLVLTDVTTIDIDSVVALRALTSLNVYGGNLDDTDMSRIAELGELESLAIADCDLTDDGVAHLTGLKSLKSLDVSGTKITSQTVQLLGAFPNLVSVDLSDTQIRNDDLRHLPSQLTELTLIYCNIDRGAIEHILKLNQLESLYLNGTNLSGDDISPLAALELLSFLDLTDLQLSPEGLKSLGDFSSLTTLWITGLELTDQHYDALSELTQVTEIDLAGSNLSDEGLMRLVSMRNLEVLSIEDTMVSQTAIDRFSRRRPDCDLYVDADKL